jgi:hypothetical protein
MRLFRGTHLQISSGSAHAFACPDKICAVLCCAVPNGNGTTKPSGCPPPIIIFWIHSPWLQCMLWQICFPGHVPLRWALAIAIACVLVPIVLLVVFFNTTAVCRGSIYISKKILLII